MATLLSPLLLQPHLTARPWGGDRLFRLYGKGSAPGTGIGEAWELSDHPDGPSTVAAGGGVEGELFGELIRRYPREMLGIDPPPERFPLLVKYIDAQDDLSIQVHPDDEYCVRTGIPDRGKTECWYVMAAEPGTELVYGLQPGVTRTSLHAAIEAGEIQTQLARVPVRPGSFLFVPPGTVHALLGGTMICEVQQSSNITFRLYDWDRQPARELHLNQSLEVITFGGPNAASGVLDVDNLLAEGGQQYVVLTENPYFRVAVQTLDPKQTASFHLSKPGVLNVVQGAGQVNDLKACEGQTWFLPACLEEVVLTGGETGLRVLLSFSNEL